ncbi:hypothetical protein CEQ90_03670 [Lewinellaceae bacterium SD302]|nr:hypothetical protein CEQ90_03670 [Lewinellaceae bacterium SD302]
MPDNTPHDWNADEQFWAEAWKDMEGRLDRKMPVEKRRRGIAFWLIGSLFPLLAFAWVTLFTPVKPADSLSPTDTPFVPVPTAPITPKVSAEGDVPLASSSPAFAKQDEQEGTLAENSGGDLQSERQSVLDGYQMPARPDEVGRGSHVVEVNDGKEPASIAEVMGAKLDDQQAVEFPALAESTRSSNSDILVPQSSNQLAVTPEAIGQTLITIKSNNQASSLYSNSEIVAPIPTYASELENVVRMEGDDAVTPGYETVQANTSLTQRITPARLGPTYQPQLYVGGSLGTQMPGLGYLGGVGLSRKIGSKGRLTATLGYRVQQESIQIGARASDESAFPTPVTMDTSEEILIAEFNGALDSNTDVFLRGQYVRLGLSYARNLGNKFYLAAGGGINLLTRADLSTSQMNDASLANFAQRDFDFVNITSGNFLSGNSAVSGESLEGYLGLRRLRYDLDLMAGYRLNQHFSLEAGVKHYVSPVLNTDNFNTDRWRGEVKLLYRF